MSLFPSLIFAVVLYVSAAEMDSFPDLYAIENDPTAREDLVRVSMDRENKLVRETLLSMSQGFFGPWQMEGTRIALGRFIVTRHGGVVDIEGGKVIHDEHRAKVLGVEDGKVVYRIPADVWDDDGPSALSELFSFDLNERKLAKVPKGTHWDLPGLKSPDRRMSVKARNGVVRLHRLGKAPEDLAKDGCIKFSELTSEVDFSWVGVCLWLDGEHILAGQTNRKLIILTTHGAVERSIEVKDAPPEVISPPRLWRDPLGRVIYHCGFEDFLIDVSTRVASRLKRYSLGHGFEASVAADLEERRSVYHDGKIIGQWEFNPREAKTLPGLLAFRYFRPNKKQGVDYPAGVAVWSQHVGDWRTIKMWVEDLIGWSR
jgi:hypothetical protein